MKTTVELTDTLLAAARTLAAKEGVTLRAVIERGLHKVVAEAAARPAFKLRDASFTGEGLHPDVADGDWAAIRERAYGGRGG